MSETPIDPPLLSIGLAVYNGERYLASAIESILAQTFEGFELIISDNASTDESAEIAKRFADSDARIRYHRNHENIGGANNENLTFQLSRGKYFRLAAHDDLCAPTLFAECIDILETRPDIVLCYTHMVKIDEDGNETGRSCERRGTGATAAERFRELSDRNHHCEATYGVVRSDVVHRCRLQENYTNSDRVWLCELAMHGRFAVVPQALFYKRYHPQNDYLDWRGRMAWFRPDHEHRISIPNWLELRALVRVAATAPVSNRERLRCLGVVAGWVKQFWKELAKDITYSGLSILRIRPVATLPSGNWEG